jgi:hypothetical protein
MKNLLQNLPNLSQLKIETQSIDLDGYQWEYLISDYLPKLKMFQLKMLIIINDSVSREQQVNDLLDSFRSRFWLKERQWFVRCHWNSNYYFKTIYLYTLPYAFTNYDHFMGTKSQSTCPNNVYSYNRVRSLNYNNYLDGYFSRIHHLIISFPIFVLPNFNSLISLDVSLTTSNDSSYLQVLLDQTPCLYALKVSNSFSIQEILTKNTSHSIRRLDFLSHSSPIDGLWFNGEQCISLARSSLGIQCEVLLIRLTDCENILDLIHDMNNLRALNVECQDDVWCAQLLEKDKLVTWLEYRLPESSTIRRDANSKEIIQIWIGN